MKHFLPYKEIFVISVSLILLVTACWMVGIQNILMRLNSFPVWAIVTIVLLQASNLFVVSFRFWRMLYHFGVRLPWAIASRASISGHVAALFMISLFGQVVGRQAVLRAHGVSPLVISGLASYERMVLFLVSGVSCLLGMLWVFGQQYLSELVTKWSVTSLCIALFLSFLLSFLLGRSKFELTLREKICSWENIFRFIEVVVISLLGFGLMLGCYVIAMKPYLAEHGLTDLFAAAAIISFAATLPITVNGWGVREIAAVFVLEQLGVSKADALIVSVAVGALSMLVIASAIPFSIRHLTYKASSESEKQSIRPVLDMEKVVSWCLGMLCAVLVLFQVHLELESGLINLNLADPFAILALTSTILMLVLSRNPPLWRNRYFNSGLLAITLLLIFGFVKGWMVIGVTQWAFVGRLMGWLVLLGYLSVGYLLVAYSAAHGRRRFFETMASTMIVIVIVSLSYRVLVLWGWVDGYISYNFEGFSGNRNAFALQLLIVISMMIAYSKVYLKAVLYNPRISYRLLLSLAVLLVALVWTGSRAGLITGGLLLLLALFSKVTDKKIIIGSVLLAAGIWGIVFWIQSIQSIQSISSPNYLSREVSNSERWLTFVHAFELWKQFPLTGVGLGVFIAKSTAWLGHPQVIHSTLLWLLAELGLLGFVVVSSIFFVLAQNAWKQWSKSLPDRILFMVLAVVALFSQVHEIFYQRIFWLVLGVLLAKPILDKGKV